MISTDPMLISVVSISLIILLIGALLKKFKQPFVIVYILAGFLAGPSIFGLVHNEVVISQLGNIGVVLLLFFVGMEVNLDRLISRWRIAVFGTAIQILASVLIIWLIGLTLQWPFQRVLLIGFVISLSSTAVVLKILEEWKEQHSRVGQNATGILIIQDLAVVPMLIILSLFAGEGISASGLFIQFIGGALLLMMLIFIIKKRSISIPFVRELRQDREIQVFAALILCFGLALITGVLGLSSALGAFAAGVIISSTKEAAWVHDTLSSFRVVFVAMFFVSIGLLINLSFLLEHFKTIALVLLFVLLLNTFVNAAALHFLNHSWRESLYTGSILAQIGEFSFILAAFGFQNGIISDFTRQLIILLISLSLLISPFWIYLFKSVLQCRPS